LLPVGQVFKAAGQLLIIIFSPQPSAKLAKIKEAQFSYTANSISSSAILIANFYELWDSIVGHKNK